MLRCLDRFLHPERDIHDLLLNNDFISTHLRLVSTISLSFSFLFIQNSPKPAFGPKLLLLLLYRYSLLINEVIT